MSPGSGGTGGAGGRAGRGGDRAGAGAGGRADDGAAAGGGGVGAGRASEGGPDGGSDGAAVGGPDGAAVGVLQADHARAVADEAGLLHVLARLNVFRLLLRRPRLARATADLLLSILAHGALDARLRELLIMRVAWVTRSAYEWAQHWRIALDLGVSEADLVGVRDWSAHRGFDAAQRCVLRAVDEVIDCHEVSPATVADLVELLGEDAAIEAVAAIGAWTMVSIVLRSFDVPTEDGLALWPPDGTTPDGEAARMNRRRV